MYQVAQDNKCYAYQINPDAHQPGCLDPDRSDAAQRATGRFHIPPAYRDLAVLMRKGFQPTGKINAVLKANALGDDIRITWDWRHLDNWMTTTLGDLGVNGDARGVLEWLCLRSEGARQHSMPPP
jgi:hypothetical protein